MYSFLGGFIPPLIVSSPVQKCAIPRTTAPHQVNKDIQHLRNYYKTIIVYHKRAVFSYSWFQNMVLRTKISDISNYSIIVLILYHDKGIIEIQQ